MAWAVANDAAACSDASPWRVFDDETDETDSCHPTEEEAQARLAELVGGDGGDGEATEDPGHFQIMVVPEGERTTDGREIADGSLTTRELPLPIMMQTENPEWGGHAGAVLAGRIDTLEREANGEWWGTGTYESGDAGQELRRLVDEQVLRWVSADIEATEWELLEEGDCSDEGWWNGDCVIIERVLEGRIMGATATPFPAFPTAVIIPEGADRQAATEDGRNAAEPVLAAAGRRMVRRSSLTAAAPPENPPLGWFENPHLDGPTALTVTADGRVYGHAWLWNECHTGRPDSCVVAPRSPSGYAYFRTGIVRTAEGRDVAVGQITMETGHADLHLGHRMAAAHYDNTGSVIADVACGEDEYGGWVAGAVRSGVADEQLRTLSAAALSGDWRPIGGNLELVALLAVNVPGFPVPRARALMAAGTPAPQALVAAGMVRGDALGTRLARLERTVERLAEGTRAQRVAALRQRVGVES